MLTFRPQGWKTLNADQYNGTIITYENLDVYVTYANLYTINDVLLCWVFPTLVWSIFELIHTIAPNFIAFFETFVAWFDTQFASSCNTLKLQLIL